MMSEVTNIIHTREGEHHTHGSGVAVGDGGGTRGGGSRYGKHKIPGTEQLGKTPIHT